MIIDIVFEYICPVLIVLWMVSSIAGLTGFRGSSGLSIKGFIVLFSLGLALYPIKGFSLSEYILSLNPNFSLGSLALLLVLVSNSLFNNKLLSDKQLLMFSGWNIFISLFVFIPALGYTGMDIYVSGYGFSLFFILMALVTVFMVHKKSPLAYIFIAYIVAFNLKVLPSMNFFDYITDGILFFISLGVMIVRPHNLCEKGSS